MDTGKLHGAYIGGKMRFEHTAARRHGRQRAERLRRARLGHGEVDARRLA